ncbi:MAG TPA: arginase family protein [Thermoanaerobaculia bacterium]|jgi:arginase|nr:arginase family protein [Thermoanaerobaculia bacterium]
MSGRVLQLLIVPFDVERRDTPMARGPAGLMARGFQDRLQDRGWEVHLEEAEIPEGLGKLATVVAVGRWIAQAVETARARERLPLVLSGGCLSSVGALAGLQRLGSGLAVSWIDAHGDFNTPETTRTGYWDGMALATVCGLSLPEAREGIGLRPLELDRVVHLAGRDFDPLEIESARRLGLTCIPPDRMGTAESLQRLLRFAEDRRLYLHVDVDGLDPGDAPAAGYPVPGGPSLENVLRSLAVLPAPAAMTFSALGFDRVDEEEAARTVETCARLVGIP